MTAGVVLHLVTSLDFGGVETHMRILATLAPEARYRPVFCALGGGGAAERQLRVLGAEVHYLHRATRIPSVGALFALFRLLRCLRPRVVHCHGAEANFHGLVAAFAAGVPVRIAEEIGLPRHSLRARFAFRRIYRLAHRLVCVSRAVAEFVVALGEVRAAQTAVIRTPALIPEPCPPASDPEHFTMLFIGRLNPVKNLRVLIPVLGRLHAEGVPARLWIVGEGDERAALAAASKAAGLAGQVTLFGFRDDVKRFLAGADVFVLPSHSEGLGLALVEAMGAGLPAVVSKVGGGPEVIEQGVTGWAVPPDDPAEIAGALRQIWQLGPEARREIGRSARASVINRFDPARYLARLERLYDDPRGWSDSS